MKLLLTDCGTLSSNGDLPLEVFKKYGEVTYNHITSSEELLSGKFNPDIILCNKTHITREVMESMPNLKYIGLFATGYNNIDVVAAKELGVAVISEEVALSFARTNLLYSYVLNTSSAK